MYPCTRNIYNMSLCTPCQATVDEDPIAVLLRRDEFGNNLLCNNCRRTIYSNNVNAQNGFHTFTFENPNTTQKKTAQPTLCTSSESVAICCASDGASWERWYCKLCKSRVWAKPRTFDGENEPEDWLWCNTCKKQKKEQMFLHFAQRKAEELKRELKQSKKAECSKQQLHCYPKLDKFLR